MAPAVWIGEMAGSWARDGGQSVPTTRQSVESVPSLVDYVLIMRMVFFRLASGRCRRGQTSESFGDHPVTVLGGVLISQRGVRSPVSHSSHQFTCRGARGRCPSVAGVSEVV